MLSWVTTYKRVSNLYLVISNTRTSIQSRFFCELRDSYKTWNRNVTLHISNLICILNYMFKKVCLYLDTCLLTISNCPGDGPWSVNSPIWTLASVNLARKGSVPIFGSLLSLGLHVQAIHNSEGSEETQCHNNSSPWHPPWSQSDLREAETSGTSISEKTDQ